MLCCCIWCAGFRRLRYGIEGPPTISEMSTDNTSYFKRHVFFCLNERANGEACCAQHNAQAAFDHCKKRVKELGLAGLAR